MSFDGTLKSEFLHEKTFWETLYCVLEIYVDSALMLCSATSNWSDMNSGMWHAHSLHLVPC